MKNNIKTKTHNLYKIVFLFVVFLGIGYAFLEANLNINGDVTVEAPELNAYIQGVSVTTGSTPGTPVIVGNDKKEVEFSTALTNDGNSFYEETTTLVNKGTKDVYLLNIQVKVYDSNDNEVTLQSPYEYSLTKSDGTQIEIGKKIDVGLNDSYKLKFNYEAGTDMSTVTDYPTYTFKIVYNYGTDYVPPICASNINITNFSATTCTNNENVTVPSGTICKRAINLHEEECTHTNSSFYCLSAGYSADGSKHTTTMTYGSCGTSGTLTSGDAFTCDVNGDGTFDELLERFYYVSDYYDTKTLTFDTSIATLSYYSNVAGGAACNSESYYYYTSDSKWYGPETLREQLPTTAQWPGVSLKSDTRAILGEWRGDHNNTGTGDHVFPTDFSYAGYAARLLTAQEIMNGCGLRMVGFRDNGELDNCNYLMENTKYADPQVSVNDSILETPTPGTGNSTVNSIYGAARCIFETHAHVNGSQGGVRPAIDVPKSQMVY